ncbi:MAG: 3-hydroxyacyl-CoA dehydrogenase [Candidatus Bathyarchaeia archaeon]
MAERLEKAAVIGGGVMGHGITQVLAMYGFEVSMVDVNRMLLEKALEKIKWSLDKFVEKKRLRRENADAAFSRIKVTTSIKEAVENVDFAIEAVSENMDLKKQVFSEMDRFAPPHAVLASNTSTLSITEIAKATGRCEKVAGMHFFNPPQIISLVEVVKGESTSGQTIDFLVELAGKIGKTPVTVRKDVCGFIVNRVLGAVFNEAFWAYFRGEASKEAVDASLKYGAGFPMGVFELADFVGLDLIFEIGKRLYMAYGERFKPCFELVEPFLAEGKLGQKTGFGFYDWSRGKPRISLNLMDEYDFERSWAVAVNEAAWLLNDDAASPVDIDAGLKLGAGWPSGPCEYADRTGLDVVVQRLKMLYTRFGMEIYKPCPLLEDYVGKGWLGRKTGKGFY